MAASHRDDSSESSEDLLRPDSEGWEDAEVDEEQLEVKDFFSDETFPSAISMVKYCAEKHGVDFLKLQKDFDLDFYGSMKLANYLRSEAKNGNNKPDVSSKDVFQDDKYLQPTLQDDALLFCLDDLDTVGGDEPQASSNPSGRIAELEEKLAALQSQFVDYRATVAKTFDEGWTEKDEAAEASKHDDYKKRQETSVDSSYFESYSYNEIHQVMLQDTVRTDAYRDFIYANKHLFKDKVVLDVGCGTGILSMFCAKAGAKRVISVDNSAIIEKARSIVDANGLSDKVTFIRGKIEEINLPYDVDKVDVIVSEWMGYCLLFEAMFDSVMYARDRYLKPDGLMVPSHCTLQIGALDDSEFVADNFTFWKDVYGFDMTAMTEKIYDDVLVRFPEKENVAGRSKDEKPFKVLDLHRITAAELDFKVPFEVAVTRDMDALDGWCVWFDTIFMQSKDQTVPDNLLRGIKGKGVDSEQTVVFTTGPFGPQTHWRCGTCMIDHKDQPSESLKAGQVLTGSISFRKNDEHKRALDIDIEWKGEDAKIAGKQEWFMQ